jgi:hypothetical protein
VSTDLSDTLASDATGPGHRRRRIFIVYENHEQQVAQALQDLLKTWGFEAFFCRQEIRVLATSEGYRRELAENLANADLVILILSNGFQHSLYCQAEAGATVTLKKHQIHITIPPVDADDIKRISPVLEGWELIDGSMSAEVVRVLRNRLRGVFKDPGMLEAKNAETELHCGEAKKLLEALDDVIRTYKIEPPEQAQIGVWESLTDPRASASIVAHIRRAVADGEANIAVVGVSLKYSIHIITQAIKSLAAKGKMSWRGPLTIELVHVDDQSHILHTLKDDIDISSVLSYFRIGWEQTKADWEKKCKDVGIEVNVAAPVAIDYIPQQVGVRIKSLTAEWSVLYAGRCSFESAGAGTRLLVGEGEYFFYSSPARTPRGPKAIEVFDQYVRHYRSPQHNGATLVLNHNEWIARLESCLSNYQGLRELVLVSNTTTKFRQLIITALSRGLLVRVYSRDPELLSPRDATLVKSLEEELTEGIAKLGAPCPGRAELRYFHHTPTFRAAVIGEAVLGLQAYTIQGNAQTADPPSRPAGSHKRGESVAPSELRLIVTRHGEHFQELRKMVDLQCEGADPVPYAVLGNRQSLE